MAESEWDEYRVEYLEPGAGRWQVLRATKLSAFAAETAREAREGNLYRLPAGTEVRVRTRRVTQSTTPWRAIVEASLR